MSGSISSINSIQQYQNIKSTQPSQQNKLPWQKEPKTGDEGLTTAPSTAVNTSSAPNVMPKNSIGTKKRVLAESSVGGAKEKIVGEPNNIESVNKDPIMLEDGFKAKNKMPREKKSLENELTSEEQKLVAILKARDYEVRKHEQAHVSAGGGLASAPCYEYAIGPDGKQYAVGGYVKLQTSGSKNVKTAIREARTMISAATAPAEPSSADLAIAAKSRSTIQKLAALENMIAQENRNAQMSSGF